MASLCLPYDLLISGLFYRKLYPDKKLEHLMIMFKIDTIYIYWMLINISYLNIYVKREKYY